MSYGPYLAALVRGREHMKQLIAAVVLKRAAKGVTVQVTPFALPARCSPLAPSTAHGSLDAAYR